VAVLALACSVGAVPAADPPAPPVCHECFWDDHDPDLRRELSRFYAALETDDRLVAADIERLLARVRRDAGGTCDALATFKKVRRGERDPERRLLIDETLAFDAAACGRDPGRAFRRAARSAAAAGDTLKAHVYAGLVTGASPPAVEPTILETSARLARVEIPAGAETYVLGESAIRVPAGKRVGVQVERTVRDWFSYRMRHDFRARPREVGELLDYHEGARLRDVLDVADAEVVPLGGALAVRHGDRWYAPDAEGRFRFEVLPDKLQYPTTRVHGDLALLVDTHGISALVAPAVRAGAQLVVGCGDSAGKVAAACDLARRGIDVYFPCDRFVGDLIGYDAPGTLIGSAPVRGEGGVAVIGDRPVELRVDEPLVVQDTAERGAIQYYDAPARYFRRLAELVPLRIEWVSAAAAGQSARVVAAAERLDARAVAVRVWTEEDYRAVRDWLAGSPDRRAVLFHSVAYPAGERLFREFPGQTTFGDPRPRFVGSTASERAAVYHDGS
jgi:hypothetical protein